MNIAPKTAAAGLGGSLSVVLLWIAGSILAHWQITIPAEVAAAFSTLISTLASYYAPRSHPPSPPVDSEMHSDRETTIP